MLNIGSVQLASPLLLSPIAGYCDLSFRLTIRPLGGLSLACTELINPRGLMRKTWRSMELAQSDPADRPLCIQLYGGDPNDMAEAAKHCVDYGADIVDINMGCPADKIIKRAAGSALLRERDHAIKLVEAVVKASELPVTVKMRLGWDAKSIVAPQLARDFENAGVAAITIHGRTAEQQFRDDVHLDEITRVVEATRHIPVIGNGDILCPQDAKRMIDQTGCAGVMIGRAALKDPWIFRDTYAYLTTGEIPQPPTTIERLELIREHFRRLVQYKGEYRACLSFRQRISWYTKQLGPCPAFREQMRLMTSAEDCERAIDSFPGNWEDVKQQD